MPEKKNLTSLRKILHQQLPMLSEKYHVRSLWLFGSYARSQQHKESDLDILIEFDKTPGLLTFIEIENYLSDLLGLKVDLVMKRALKPRIGKRIKDDIVPV